MNFGQDCRYKFVPLPYFNSHKIRKVWDRIYGGDDVTGGQLIMKPIVLIHIVVAHLHTLSGSLTERKIFTKTDYLG